MAESAAVTDTHALLFHAAGGRRLGTNARALFRAAEERRALIYVPIAVVWEVTTLTRSGRLTLNRPTREFFGDLFSNPSYQAHTLDASQVFDAGEITALRDPFDALICAAALDLSLPLITRDAAIVEARRVKTVW
ncbi:MAG TPA: type II toxin-antitoxin system VapC family toxin [Vicinamibacterales bacterium]|nr:type II toxin-antitoxin system VapC family toxin [Vicinamibacterales bacterium]